MRLLTTVPLAVVAVVATLAAIPVAEGDDAHAAQAGPTMFVVKDSALGMFHPNGTFAFERDVRIPGGIGIGPDGRIVSLRYGDCQVRVHHPNGTEHFCFGKLGRGPGEFDNAYDLAVGPDGRIAVTDPGNARVQVFHPNGTLAFAFGTRADGQLPDPAGVDIGPDGRVYVVNAWPHPHNVTVLHPNGTLDFSSALSGVASGRGVIAVGPDGRFALLGSGYDVKVFHPNGTLDIVIGSRGYGKGQFNAPSDIAIHPDGRIAVVDSADDRVQVFHPNGTHAFAFGTLGRGPGQLEEPSHIAIGPVMLPPPPASDTAPPPPPPPQPPPDDAHAAQAGPTMFVVKDSALGMFHPNGTFAFERDVRIPGGIGIGPDGRIVSLRYGDCQVRVHHPNGTEHFCFGKLGRGPGEFDNAYDLAVGPDGRIAVTDPGNARVQVFHPNGTLAFAFGTRADGQLPDPAGVDIGPDGRVYVVNAWPHPHNVTVLHPNGTLDFSSALSGVASGRGVIAVGPDGRFALLGSGYDVKVFHPNGTLDIVIGSRGYGKGQFNAPSDIAIHPDGRIAVVDSADDRVQVFHPNGTHAFAFGTLGRGPGQLEEPSHIAIGPVMLPTPPPLLSPPPPTNGTAPPPPPLPSTPVGPPDGTAPPPDPPSHSEPRQDVIVVSYYNGSILAYHPANGTLAFAFGQSAAAAADGDGGQFDGPSEVAVGPDGTVVVVDDDHRVRAYHPNGTFAFDVGSYDGSYRFPANADGVGIGPDGSIAVADFRHGGRVFHPNGTLAFTFELEWGGNVTDRHTIAADVGPDGRIFVGGAVGIAGDPGPSRRIQAFHPNGTFDFAFGSHGMGPGQFYWGPYDVAVGPDGRIFATEHCDVIGCGDPANRVQVFHPNGTLASVLGAHGDGRGLVSFPNRVAVGPDGGVYVVDDARVLAFHPNGTIAFIIWSPANDTWPNVPSDVAVGPVPPPLPPPPPPAPVAVVIEPGAAPGPLNFTGAGDAADLAIDVAGLAAPGAPPLDGSASSKVTFPPAETSIAASFATVTFPPGVAATHVPADGRLALRVAADVPDDARVQGALAYEGSGRVTLRQVVEVGAASGRVVFDMPVRILLEDQAGGRAFYIDGGMGNGTITPIDQACAADDTGRVHRHLGGAGECQTDSAAGDKIIHTYHLTRFGTAQPERDVPPPTVDTCSVGIGDPDPRVSARPGGYSDAFRQEVVNSGSAQFAHVSLTATQWSNGLPASATEVSADVPGGAYVPLADGTAVAGGLGGGEVAPVWFRVNLTPHGGVQAGELVQTVTYQAACGAP